MPASIFRFPDRRAACIWILPEGQSWFVRAYEHGWLHGSSHAADEDAAWLSKNYGLPIRAVTVASS